MVFAQFKVREDGSIQVNGHAPIINNTREGLKRIKPKSSGRSFERVCEELDWLRPTLTVPLWIIGLK